jgi:Flp pilus assembly protein TadD
LIAADNNLGTALLQSGDKVSARVAFENTLKLQPSNSYAKLQLSHIH